MQRIRRYGFVRWLIVFILAASTSYVAKADNEDIQGARILFERLNHNFGTLTQGSQKVSYDFHFTNEGDAPLIITRTTTSCRCITIKSPKRPIRPGEKGVLSVTFDPRDVGVTNKAIDVHANIPGGKITLFIRGEVTDKK